MSSLSLALCILLLTVFDHALSQDTAAIQPTTLHFFPRTSCNRGTSLSYITVSDLYADNACHTTPVGTEAIYVDGVAEDCFVQAFSDSACSPSALLSQQGFGAGTCQFYGGGNAIGAWIGVCGAAAAAAAGNGSASESLAVTTAAMSEMGLASTTDAVVFSTMNVPANSSVVTTTTMGTGMGGAGAGGNATTTYKATGTVTPGLQSPGGVLKNLGTGLRDEEWVKGMVLKGLLMMGGAEVVWGWGF